MLLASVRSTAIQGYRGGVGVLSSFWPSRDYIYICCLFVVRVQSVRRLAIWGVRFGNPGGICVDYLPLRSPVVLLSK